MAAICSLARAQQRLWAAARCPQSAYEVEGAMTKRRNSNVFHPLADEKTLKPPGRQPGGTIVPYDESHRRRTRINFFFLLGTVPLEA